MTLVLVPKKGPALKGSPFKNKQRWHLGSRYCTFHVPFGVVDSLAKVHGWSCPAPLLVFGRTSVILGCPRKIVNGVYWGYIPITNFLGHPNSTVFSISRFRHFFLLQGLLTAVLKKQLSHTCSWAGVSRWESAVFLSASDWNLPNLLGKKNDIPCFHVYIVCMCTYVQCIYIYTVYHIYTYVYLIYMFVPFEQLLCCCCAVSFVWRGQKAEIHQRWAKINRHSDKYKCMYYI